MEFRSNTLKIPYSNSPKVYNTYKKFLEQNGVLLISYETGWSVDNDIGVCRFLIFIVLVVGLCYQLTKHQLYFQSSPNQYQGINLLEAICTQKAQSAWIKSVLSAGKKN